MKTVKFAKLVSPLFVGVMAVSSLISPVFAEEIGDKLIILSTNDVHCSVDTNLGYTGLAAYRDQLEEVYGADYVILVDAGDAVQGGALGTLSKGQSIIDLMNAVEYDYFVPGNHEFDYGMAQHFVLMDQLNAHILSANFIDETAGKPLYDGYDVVDFGEIQVGFVGMTTPDSFSGDFKDENGNTLYHLGESENKIFDYIQSAIDGAVAEGADVVVGIGHIGTDTKSAPFRSTDIISNTYGLDIFIDGHSHDVVLHDIHQDSQGNDVILTQTGAHFDHIGEIVIDLQTLEIEVDFVPEDFALTNEKVDSVLAEVQAEFEEILQVEVAESEVDLLFRSPEVADDLVRLQETNLGNLVADAYRVVMESDVALINAGGIRASLEKGPITYEDIINIHPFGNEVSSMKVTGQVLLDALETGARYLPEGSSGLLHVSGMRYSVNLDTESTVIMGDQGDFLSVEGAYRVENVFIGDEPLDLEKIYTVGAIDYLLLNGGNGMSMFQGNELVKESLFLDSDLLIIYIRDVLEGSVGKEYENIDGVGRITVGSFSEAETEVVEKTEVVEPEELDLPDLSEEPEEPELPDLSDLPELTPTEESPVETEPENITYIVRSGDNLSRIASAFLGNANRWGEIYAYNRGIIKSPDLIYVGQVLQLPIVA